MKNSFIKKVGMKHTNAEMKAIEKNSEYLTIFSKMENFTWVRRRKSLAKKKNINCCLCINSCADNCFECGANNKFINYKKG